MSVARGPRLMWFGVLGAPLAWTVQLWSGIALTFADCGASGAAWNLPVGTLRVVLAAVPVSIALLAGTSAYAVLRATGDASGEPPAGRVRFLATIGLAVSFVFCCLTIMTGLGVALIARCQAG